MIIIKMPKNATSARRTSLTYFTPLRAWERNRTKPRSFVLGAPSNRPHRTQRAIGGREVANNNNSLRHLLQQRRYAHFSSPPSSFSLIVINISSLEHGPNDHHVAATINIINTINIVVVVAFEFLAWTHRGALSPSLLSRPRRLSSCCPTSAWYLPLTPPLPASESGVW
jgi:hypothetical protein